MTSKQANTSRFTIIALIAIFLIPILLAYYLFINKGQFHFSTSNYGEFITPPVAVDKLNSSVEKGRWWLAYANTEQCQKTCENNIAKLESIHLALGKNSREVNRLFIHPSHSEEHFDQDSKFVKNHPNLNIISADSDTLRKFIQRFPNHRKDKEQFYIIDPHGSMILHYATNAAGTGILRDMRHLLKVQNG